MTDSRSVTHISRLAAAAVVAVAVLPLSGCLFSAIPPESEITEIPAAGPEPTEPDTTEPSGDAPSTLSFDDGALLPETAYIEWGDGFMTDNGWEVTAPDNGNGSWTYGTVDGVCTAEFWQGLASDVPTTPGDDSASSDAILGVLLQADASEVTPHAVDVSFTYQMGGGRDVDFRQLTGEQDGRTWIISARAFTATGGGLYVIVDCTGGDANAVLEEVIEKNAIIVS